MWQRCARRKRREDRLAMDSGRVGARCCCWPERSAYRREKLRCRFPASPRESAREILAWSRELAEALILREIKCLAAAIVDARKEDRSAVGHAELIACKRRENPNVQIPLLVKAI